MSAARVKQLDQIGFGFAGNLCPDLIDYILGEFLARD